MTNEQDMTLVFKDQAGEYYLLPQETLEQCRIPEEHKAEIERLIAEQQDVQGYRIVTHGGMPDFDWQLHAVISYNRFLRWQWDTAR